MRHDFPPGPLVGLTSVPLLLAVVRPGPAGWVVGATGGLVLAAALALGLVRASRWQLLPGDRVTLARAVLVCGVAALVADATAGSDAGARSGLLVTLAGVALVLDGVDGLVARRTGTVHPLGARFDLETDAALIAVLSVHAASLLGGWVLAVGAARYLLLVVALAARRMPWLRGQVPARRWRKLVAAYQGVGLTAVASAALPPSAAALVVATGLGLLVVSFGTEVLELRRLAGTRPAPASPTTGWVPAVDAEVLP